VDKEIRKIDPEIRIPFFGGKETKPNIDKNKNAARRFS
jgi:hypothetical protein